MSEAITCNYCGWRDLIVKEVYIANRQEHRCTRCGRYQFVK